MSKHTLNRCKFQLSRKLSERKKRLQNETGTDIFKILIKELHSGCHDHSKSDNEEQEHHTKKIVHSFA